MSPRSQKRATKAAAGLAIAAGLVALAAGTAQAGGPLPGPDTAPGSRSDRVILTDNGKVGAAAAPSATLSVSSPAPRLANGAAARVTATYSCPKGFTGYLDVLVVQSASGHVSQAYGTNSRALTCNGAKQSMAINVIVGNDWPLKAGAAFARGTLDTFNETADASAITERSMTLS